MGVDQPLLQHSWTDPASDARLVFNATPNWKIWQQFANILLLGLQGIQKGTPSTRLMGK